MAPPGRLWVTGTIALTTIVANGTVAFDLTSNQPAQAANATVSRIIGWLYARQLTAGDALEQLSVGITVVSQQAFTAGSASMPDPRSNVVEADWMYWTAMIAFSSASDPAGFARVEFDNRSQRRRPGTNKVLAMLFTSESAATWQVIGSVRVLLTGL